MKQTKRVRRILLGALSASSLLVPCLAGRVKPNTQTPGEAVDGLRVSISVDLEKSDPSKTPKFRVELQNVGEHDLILNLGMMLANGEKQYPNGVTLIIKERRSHKSQQLHLSGPAAIGGRLDPLILPLPLGATFSIPVDLNNYLYLPSASQETDPTLKPGDYSLEAQFVGRGVSQQEANLDVKGIALMPYWKGTITSNKLSFEVPPEAAGQKQSSTISRAKRLASYRDAQIVESDSSLNITVNSPRPLDDVLTALAKKFGWRINYEDPRYRDADLADVTDPSWLSRHPDDRHAHVAAGGAFSVKIPLREGVRPDAEQVIAAVVKTYNSSGNPGRFDLRLSGDKWFDVVPTAASGGPEEPILDTPVGFNTIPSPGRITEFSLRVFCEELTLQSKQPIKYWDFSVERAYVPEQQTQPGIELHDPDRPAREVLRQILGDSRTASWRVHYDPDLREFMLLLRSDAW